MSKRNWAARMFDGNDASVDSIIVTTILGSFAMIALTSYDVIVERHGFSPLNFGSGMGALLAALGGGKALRRLGYSRDPEDSDANQYRPQDYRQRDWAPPYLGSDPLGVADDCSPERAGSNAVPDNPDATGSGSGASGEGQRSRSRSAKGSR